jgi:hypothetical protein
MHYIKVEWFHENSRFPILLYSELNDGRWEVRKVEVFRDGSLGYASCCGSQGATILGLEPIPPLADIKSSPEFKPAEIAKDEFEEIWRRAIQT